MNVKSFETQEAREVLVRERCACKCDLVVGETTTASLRLRRSMQFLVAGSWKLEADS